MYDCSERPVMSASVTFWEDLLLAGLAEAQDARW